MYHSDKTLVDILEIRIRESVLREFCKHRRRTATVDFCLFLVALFISWSLPETGTLM